MIDPAQPSYGWPSAPSEATGRYIVVFDAEEPDASGLLGDCGISTVADSRDFGDGSAGISMIENTEPQGAAPAALFLHELGMAVVSADNEQVDHLRAHAGRDRGRMALFPELRHFVLSEPAPAPPATSTDFADSDAFTWGLQATLAADSAYSGAGIRVAVLDTGFDVQHPDFAGRSITAESFVDGEAAPDGHGHGTHCIGTACGPRVLDGGRGYGIAHGSEIFAGKVLGNAGSGSDAGILAGIDWAMANGCAIVSMSLGANVRDIHPPYVAAGKRALAKGTLIIAAAGNNASRASGEFGFVGPPANSPYIMAVAALDPSLAVAGFSARTLPGRGGQVDTAGPGVGVYSSWPMPQRYHTISGTSMATPHVAGIAALLAEATGLRGRELWAELVQEARRLLEPSVDVGAGLVQAPPVEESNLPEQSAPGEPMKGAV